LTNWASRRGAKYFAVLTTPSRMRPVPHTAQRSSGALEVVQAREQFRRQPHQFLAGSVICRRLPTVSNRASSS